MVGACQWVAKGQGSGAGGAEHQPGQRVERGLVAPLPQASLTAQLTHWVVQTCIIAHLQPPPQCQQ